MKLRTRRRRSVTHGPLAPLDLFQTLGELRDLEDH